jgi:hypothetical protein
MAGVVVAAPWSPPMSSRSDPTLPRDPCELSLVPVCQMSSIGLPVGKAKYKGRVMEITSEPRNAAKRASAVCRLKMHLRLMPVGGKTLRVVSLRPGTKIAFSTNFYHQTWHIVTSQRGARLLARLLWGLSFERHAGTILVIFGDHLLPTPFEGERSDPILLTRAGLTRLDPATLRRLKSRLSRLAPPTKTIRWQTFGLDLVLQRKVERQNDHCSPSSAKHCLAWGVNRRFWQQERMVRLGGFICYSAPRLVLRQQALRIHNLRVRKGTIARETDYHFLAESSSNHSWCGDGEVQIFADYMNRVAAASEARLELVPNPRQPVISETVQEAISRRRDQIKNHRNPKSRCPAP